MNLLFWNIYKKDLSLLVANLCKEKDIDIVILSEHDNFDIELFLSKMRQMNFPMELKTFIPDSRCLVFSKEEVICECFLERNRYSVHKVKVNDIEFHLVSLHTIAQNNHDTMRQSGAIGRIKVQIEAMEQDEGSYLTLLIGDFNMNPFDRGMIDFYGLNATMSIDEAKKVYRVVDSEKYMYFYNPMWHYMGNHDMETLGTYYYRNTNHTLDWNTFDQILVRPQMLDVFDINNIEVITKLGEIHLISSNSLPLKASYSDHLPLYCEIRSVR